MGEEAVKKLAEEKKKMAAFLSEARIEIPVSNVAFSDPCPCCGNKKRRCLQPPVTSRKKRLIFNSADAAAAAVTQSSPSAVTQFSPKGLTPSSVRSVGPLSDSLGSPTSATNSLVASAPLPPLPQAASDGGSLAATPTSAAPPTLPPEAPLICNSEAAAEGPNNEEVRFGIKCRCGVIREFVLIR